MKLPNFVVKQEVNAKATFIKLLQVKKVAEELC